MIITNELTNETIAFWKWNLPMTYSVRQSVGWRSVCHNFLKGRNFYFHAPSFCHSFLDLKILLNYGFWVFFFYTFQKTLCSTRTDMNIFFYNWQGVYNDIKRQKVITFIYILPKSIKLWRPFQQRFWITLNVERRHFCL